MSRVTPQQPSSRSGSVWMVYKPSAFAGHWSEPYNSYGPFETRAEADEFASKFGGEVHDYATMRFGTKERLGAFS